MGGRPRVLSESARNSDAILFAGLPGFEGGKAVADIISGNFNPSGKLSFTYPAEPGRFTTYDHKHTDRVTAAWEFGHGLSYSEFEISDLQINSEEIGPDDYLTAEAIVTNHGPMAGQKNVLWFLRNEVSIITRPVRQLKHFEKIELEPGESQTVSFRITPEDHLYYPDKMGDDVIKSGYYTLMIGDESTRFYLDVPEDRASAPAH